MKILVFPRDPNPYQCLLYGEMERLGAQVIYLGRLTPSRTLNLLLLPLEMMARRVGGARMVHLHWVFGFEFPGARRLPALRRLAQIWFLAWLRITQLLGLRLAWTAHNVLPHSPVFADNTVARQILVSRCDVVFVHSSWALVGLEDLGAAPRRSVVIRHGPFRPPVPTASLRVPGTEDGPRTFLFFGKVHEYKGTADLLAAFAALARNDARLTVAGRCDDPALRSRLEKLAEGCGNHVILRLVHIPEDDVTPLLAAADAVVLPFRRVTTSGSSMLALAHGRPLVIPDLVALADLPDDAVIRYDGSIPGLTAALDTMIRADPVRLAAMSAAAHAYISEATWHDAAATIMAEFSKVLGADGARSHPDKAGRRR